METLHAVPAFQRLCDWFHLMVFLAILMMSASSTPAATYSGSHLSSTIPTDVVLGADISVTNSVKNTGSATWHSFSEPGWIYAFRNISWQPGVTITHYVWDDVTPDAQDGDRTFCRVMTFPDIGAVSVLGVCLLPRRRFLRELQPHDRQPQSPPVYCDESATAN